MRILVTGGDGFIGRNLRVRLDERGFTDVVSIESADDDDALATAVERAEFVFHLAGVNRPRTVTEFDEGNRGFTTSLCEALRGIGRPVPVAYTSSTQAVLDNPYGLSKRAGELALEQYAADTSSPVFVLRLTNVFGKWARPNYNSAVATFCHNLARGLPISINDPAAVLRLVYIDDVVDTLAGLVGSSIARPGRVEVEPTYDTTVGEVAQMLGEMAEGRQSLLTPRVGTGLTRKLYATFVTYLAPESFVYPLQRHVDARGVFAEVLKTRDCGQFSFFTAHPGVTRGGHYHHTKTERFLVLQGTARFGFRQLVTGERIEIMVRGEESRIVETIPGWVHDVTNVGEEEMIVMLWANEMFDPQKPDTIAATVEPELPVDTRPAHGR